MPPAPSGNGCEYHMAETGPVAVRPAVVKLPEPENELQNEFSTGDI